MRYLVYSFLLFSFWSCESTAQTKLLPLESKNGIEIAVFAEGCFWCSEHVFEAVIGVKEAVSGYSGGQLKNPTYQQVGGEKTGHAESIAVYYNPKIISYKELVNVFFASHDPTTPNQQGPDVGPSYRSIAFYKNAKQKKIIEDKITEINTSKMYSKKVVTQVVQETNFYEAEKYHQNYVKLHPDQSYVQGVSIPRYEAFKRKYKGKLKPNS